MRLISCTIENFGKLNNVTYNFTNACNTICEDNGWGKSTLAAFIRVMFYGFKNESKKKLADKERKRFLPWQKGVFGGEIVFETNGIVYSLRRTFAKKAADDEFLLVRKDTNLECRDFSTDIGEELFQIDAQSFERTVFIGQCDCVTASTDSINAKLGNLADNTDDINNFETAVGRLTAELNNITSTRATGSIARRRSEITRLQAQINNCAGIDKAIARQMALRNELCRKREALKADKKRKLDMVRKSKAARPERYSASKGTGKAGVIAGVLIAAIGVVMTLLVMMAGLAMIVAGLCVAVIFSVMDFTKKKQYNAVDVSDDASVNVSVDELAGQLMCTDSMLEDCFSQIVQCDRQLESLKQQSDECEKCRQELDRLERIQEEEKNQERLLKLTKQIMEDSKQSFTSGYMEPVMAGFRKYFTILTGCEPDAYRLDADTRLTVVEQNMPRDIGNLSTGKQDLIGVCMRIALIEAMYKDEKPFLIFDDPFVNLDDNNIKGAMRLLDEIAKSYQVIYFTCSESRMNN